jgi:hypothetical protein
MKEGAGQLPGPFFMSSRRHEFQEGRETMKSFTTKLVAAGVLLSGSLSSMLLMRVAAAAEDQTYLQADHEFVQAAASGNKTAIEKLVDADFTWTDAEGKTQTRAEVLKSIPALSLGNESGAEVKQRTYGEVGAVMSNRDKVYVLRLWVKRPAGWGLLVYHEVALNQQAASGGGSGVKDCENPCKTVPYTPKNETEQGIIASWQALETGVTNHDAAAWAPHVADEFVMLSSSNDHPFSKTDRIAVLNLQKETGRGSAPSPLVSAQMFDFGDAVVMTCLHQPFTGKPVHVSRLWVKKNGQWVMSISYQTTIQAAASKSASNGS